MQYEFERVCTEFDVAYKLGALEQLIEDQPLFPDGSRRYVFFILSAPPLLLVVFH